MVLLIGYSKLHLILALPNILAHYNITISYYVQVNSLWLKSNVVSKWASKKLWGGGGSLFILLLMVHYVQLSDIKKRKNIIIP